MKTKIKQWTMLTIILMGFTVLGYNGYSQENQSDIKITKISELQNYTDSYIKGEVIKILDEDEFRLEDSSGNIKVYTGWKNTNVVKKGDKITVRGKVDPGIVKEFYATEIIKEDGEIIKLKSDE
ncbi:hypothetical protein L21SP5_03209 [Salinivirga cyanobacteriivorans]|uniref:Uncharacterized protein n=1 Tax=Salinivirga cyanobacteriivorans TaxID=1307839 RepID=A0A0S2I334_9BACT|nr:NirD/YgiW/YdeI family stress tolerance protein [Salinivirga cyanobacteriivorans]ALO16824.1 hypothetical protein L21SP5_03209 [Salinivirga cyanobacteriivorans]